MNEGVHDQQPFRMRLWAVFASEAPRAVILRRGPKTHFQLIDWNLETNAVTPGQWMKGYVRLCDLSPSGSKLIYWAHQYHPGAHWKHAEQSPKFGERLSTSYEPLNMRPRKRSAKKGEKRRTMPCYMRGAESVERQARVRKNWGSWTAISTPPFFSALAIWPSFGHWTGGGVFVSEREVILNEPGCGMTPKQNTPIPSWVKFRSRYSDSHARLRLAPNAWHASTCNREIFQEVSHALKDAGVALVEWAAPREDGSLAFACDGSIYSLKSWRDVPPERYLSTAEKLADFNGSDFTQMPPPAEAMRW